MLSILIIEDQEDKRRAIEDVIRSVDELPADTQVATAGSAADARAALARTRFDLVVLDIALPRFAGSEIDESAGVWLLEEILARPDALITPTHIVGLTAYSEVFERVQGRFAGHLLTLGLYDPSASGWRIALQARLSHVIHAASAAAVDLEPRSDLCIVCALQSELLAVLGRPWSWRQEPVVGDHAIYWRGEYRLRDSAGTHVAYASLTARMGMSAAACVASKMINAFRPRFICMAGVAAGIRDRVRLADVIAADPCWDWGSGKWTVEAGSEPRFESAPHQIPLSPWVRERVRLLAADKKWLAAALSNWQGEVVKHQPRLKVGPFASGAAVLADGVTANMVLEQHRQLLGLDMEAYGVFAAAEDAPAPRPQALCMKAVVDFADRERHYQHLPLAAYLSAAAIQEFAERYV